ncbi:hypothetical protein U1737_07110 [Sphingomonas sp. LB3N6]|uniref:hypothetical protein n=1 Tax=Sphingomonas fucosidasi TaxID=3096164 RepID=UPI002FC84FE5
MSTQVNGSAAGPAQHTALRRHVAKETAIAAVINAALSLAFTYLMFGGQARVPVGGAAGLVFDAAPQTFMVTLMSLLVPRLLTRKKLLAGCGLVPVLIAPPGKAVILGTSVGWAAIVTVVAVGLQAVLLPRLGPAEWSLGSVYVFKTGYGALLGALVAAFAVTHLIMRVSPIDAVHPRSVQ